METIISSQDAKRISLHKLWEFRELIYFLVWRDIKVRYKQTVLGIIWAVLQPLVTMIIFTFFFNKLIGVSSGNIPYPIFAYTGLIFWNYFSSALSDTSNSLISNQSIITKVFFPRIIIPIFAAIVPTVDFLFSFIFLLVLFFFFHVSFSIIGIISIIPAIFSLCITVIGFGSLLAIVNIKYRDVRYALPFFIQLLLFITPVIYSMRNIPNNFQLFLYVNPLTGVIDVERSILLSQSSINIQGIMISCISSLLLLFIGIFVFIQYEKEIADIL